MTRCVSMLLAVALSLLTVVACGGRSSVPAQVAKAPPEMASLQIAVVPGSGATPAILQGVKTALVRSGFNVIEGEGAQLTGTLRVQQTREEGFLKVYRNGQLVVNYRYVVTLQVAAGERILDVATAEFVGEEGEVDNEELARIANALSNSMPIRQYARNQSDQQAVAAQQERQAQAEQVEAEQAAAEEQKRREAEVAWVEADVSGCKNPKSLDACKGVRLYLAKYPDGEHVEEANAALTEAQPKLEELQKDDDEWQKSGAAACVPGADSSACVGVELYLQKFPAGLHQVEAHETLRRAGVEQ